MAGKIEFDQLAKWPRGLSRQQAASYLGVSPSHFDIHVSVRPIRLGSRVIYDREDLDHWLESQKEGGHSEDDWLSRFDDEGDHQGPQ